MSPTATIYDQVNHHYSQLARGAGLSLEQAQKVALSFGYSAEELSVIPDAANLGASCGNPFAIAGIKAGEIVLDLGSGAGFDVFLAAGKVGSSGMAIGVDMSTEMLDRARLNAAKSSFTNVKFIESAITSINLPPSSADCIISNCVINLVPTIDKPLVFEEIARLLKPGGRVAISDILAKKTFPDDLQQDIALYVGCISGASFVEDYEKFLKDAGFDDIMIVDKNVDLNIYKDRDSSNAEEGKAVSSCCDSGRLTAPPPAAASPSLCCPPETKAGCCAPHKKASCCPPDSKSKTNPCGCMNSATEEKLHNATPDMDFNEWAGSFAIYAIKPSTSTT